MDPTPAPDPAGAPSDGTTLTEVLAAFAAQGFTADLTVADGGRVQTADGTVSLDPSQLQLHHLRRLEGASDPADMVAVAAVSGPDGLRGALVVRFGPEATADEAAVLQLLT